MDQNNSGLLLPLIPSLSSHLHGHILSAVGAPALGVLLPFLLLNPGLQGGLQMKQGYSLLSK